MIDPNMKHLVSTMVSPYLNFGLIKKNLDPTICMIYVIVNV